MIVQKILLLFKAEDKRSIQIKKNIILSLFLKGAGILINLLYVPVTLNYLNSTRYGIWMTLTSVIAWFSLFDVGLGNGLRNKLAAAIALNQKEKASKYVSTTYVMLFLIVFIFLTSFYIINVWIDWSVVLNTPKEYKKELSILAIIIFSALGLKFILQTIQTILIADQRPALASSFEVIGSAISLLAVWILTHYDASFLVFGTLVATIPVIVLIMASIFFFQNNYAYLKPSLKNVDFSLIKDLGSLGLKFFIIQIAVLVIFQTSNILIAQLFSPVEVTIYNIAFKYFSIITMLSGIIMTPLWSAFTHAITQKAYQWIKQTIFKLNIFMAITLVIIIAMAIVAKSAISLWTSNQIKIETPMIVVFAVYTVISVWNSIYANFLNGIGQIKIQVYTSIVSAIIHIPLAIFLVKYLQMGVEAIVLSMAFSLSFFAVAGALKTKQILKSYE